MDALLEFAVIFFSCAVYVTFSTFETIFVSKGNRQISPFVGGIKIAIYTAGLGYVLPKLSESKVNLLVYAMGYAFGTFVGMVIIEKMKIGETTVYATLSENKLTVIDALTSMGYGVSYYEINGRDAKRLRVEIVTTRKREKELMSVLKSLDEDAFIIAYEPTLFVEATSASKTITVVTLVMMKPMKSPLAGLFCFFVDIVSSPLHKMKSKK